MEKKLSKKTLTKSFHNGYYGNFTCFSQEHMQTFGYLCSMLPVVEELYDKKEDQPLFHLIHILWNIRISFQSKQISSIQWCTWQLG